MARRSAPARCVALLVVMALTVASAPRAYAAASVPIVAPTSVSALMLIGVDASTDTLIVDGVLPAGTALPARLELPVPLASTPAWVGEIVGSDPSRDPTAVYTTRSAQGYDIITLTLTQSREGQVEISVPVLAQGSSIPRSVSFRILGAVQSASVGFAVPAGSVVTSLSAGLVKVATAAGSDRYALTKTSPRVGSDLRASLVVGAQTGSGSGQSPGGAVAPAQQPSPPATPTDVFLWVMLLGAIAFFLYNAYRFTQARSARIAGEAARLAEPVTPSVSGQSGRGAAPGTVLAQGSIRHVAPHRGGDTSAERELRRLQDLRSHGAMSREEFLRAKRRLLDDAKG